MSIQFRGRNTEQWDSRGCFGAGIPALLLCLPQPSGQVIFEHVCHSYCVSSSSLCTRLLVTMLQCLSVPGIGKFTDHLLNE